MNALSEPRAVRVLRSLQHGTPHRPEEPSALPREPGERTRDLLSGCMARLSARPLDGFEPVRRAAGLSPR